MTVMRLSFEPGVSGFTVHEPRWRYHLEGVSVAFAFAFHFYQGLTPQYDGPSRRRT